MQISVRGALLLLGLAALTLLLWTTSVAVAGEEPGKQATCIDPGTRVEIMCPTIDKLQVNGSATSPASIKTAIDKVAAEDRSTVVVDISFGETVPMSVLFDVHATLRELKLWKVNYVVPEKEGVPMTLPRQSGSEQLKGIDSRYIATLSVNSKGVVALDETQIESDEVATLIKRRLDETSGLIISIEAANKTNYGDFLAVLTQVRDAGAPRIVIGGPTG